MKPLNRRQFFALAAAMGASGTWATPLPKKNNRPRVITERRDLFPEGVASGDPDSNSVLLWTRRPFAERADAILRVEIYDDEALKHVVASSESTVAAAADWTCRVLVGNLKPAHIYWYRFIDSDGNASRVGRTITAPLESDSRPVRFAFVSCQNVNLGEQHAYRRMLYEDERAARQDQLGFVLHLGDFIYEIVCYPEETPRVWGHRVRDILRYPHGEKIGDFNIPTTVDDYRVAYRAYLRDPDLQNARARWPFVAIWDNHEFSAGGWQSLQVFQGKTRPRQTRKVAANQAWFEYLPSRVRKSGGPSLTEFIPPAVSDVAIETFDANGLGQEINNLTALNSLTAYRALRWGRHVEIMITDQRSYRSERPGSRPKAKALWSKEFPNCVPQETLEAMDAGRAYGGGQPPTSLQGATTAIPNFRRDEPTQTILGAEQKRWFLERLKTSAATWKIWGCTTGTLDRRVDLQQLPPGLTVPWLGRSFASYEDGDHGSAWVERSEIYTVLREQKITGFVTIAGDRHSFWAGLAAPTLPPKSFDPVGVAFITASLSAPNSAEPLKQGIPIDHPLRQLYFVQLHPESPLEPTINLLLRHGVSTCLEYTHTGDLGQALKHSNPALAPHLKFVDLDAYGYSIIRASSEALECEFVCIQRPEEPLPAVDGGPVRYRIMHRAPLWRKEQTPLLEQRLLEGNQPL